MYGADDPRYGIPDPADNAGQNQNPWTADEDQQAQTWAAQYMQQHGIPASWGQTQDLVNAYYQQRRTGVGHDAAMQAAPGSLGWDKYQAPTPTPDPGPTPTPTTGPGQLPSPFSSPFTAPAQVNLGGPAGIPYIPPTPSFTPPAQRIAPAFQAPDPFKAPSMQDVLNDPGYQFPLTQGLGAISNGKAAQGLWATGGTGKAFQDYAQNYANQFYDNIYARNLNTYQTNYGDKLSAYNTNYGTQYKDPNTYDYQAAKDAFAPQILGYQTQAAAGQHQNDLNYSNAYSYWLDQYNQKLGTARFLLDTANS